MTTRLLTGWGKSIREKVDKDPALQVLVAKHPMVILHSRRYAGGGYLQSAYSFIHETSNEGKHFNDVQLLFDNGGRARTFGINMVTNQQNVVADLGNVDFEKDPDTKQEDPDKGNFRQEGYQAVEGHVYLERVQDTVGNKFFVVFKVVALDEESRYFAFIWRRLPGGKVVKRR
jgi:hypothetical protein